jgi:hypothetical protein
MYRFFMTQRLRIGLTLVGIFGAALVLGYVGLVFLLRSMAFTEWAQAELSRRIGMEIRWADLALRPPFQLTAGVFEVSKPGEFRFRAARLRVTFTPLDLWSKTVHSVSAEQPALTIDLAEMMQPSGASSPGFGLRSLKLQDGLIVLRSGDAKVFELPNINLEARNLNLGQESGIRLRADVPWLQGETDLYLAGGLRALAAELVLRPKPARQAFSREAATHEQSEILRLRAKLDAPENQPARATIEGKFEKLEIGSGQISGGLNARATIDNDWKEFLFTGHAALHSIAEALGPAAKLSGGGAAMDFSGAFLLSDKTLKIKSTHISSPFGNAAGDAVASFADQPRINEARLLWSDLPLAALRPMLPPPYNLWRIDGRGQADLDVRGPFRALEIKGAVRGEGAKIQGGEVNLASVSFTAPFEWTNDKALVREAKIAASGFAYNGKNRWQATAKRAQLSGSADFSDRNSLKLAATIDLSGGKFASPDGSKIGENLTIHGPLEIAWLSGKNSARIAGDLTAQSGEILWSKFFTDLKAQRPKVTLDGEYLPGEDRLECRRCSAALVHIGAVDITGSVEGLADTPRLRLEARSAKISPGAFFEAFVRENLNRQYPFLDTLTMRGTLAFQARLNGSPENLQLAGDLSLPDGELRAKAGNWEIGAIDLKLPFDIGWGEATKASGDPRPGAMTIGKLRFAGREMRLSPATISLFHNELRFHEPLHAIVFGGEIIVGNLRWPDVIRLPRQLTFSLNAKGLRLQELTETFNWPPFSGTLTGSIPEVQSAATTLKTNGEIHAEVFGGRVRISKMEIENPFSSLAAIRLDAALANIELEQLSKTFAFGRISGILEGTVADLIITDGQPAQFGADLHSVDRGVQQRISVEALNKITVLSSGQSAGGLYGGLAGLFDSFRYSKLGFKAILRNDRLVLRGVETRGDQEYLVVGSLLPPTVNIVSHTQTIGFSELLRRLERIQMDSPKAQ